MNVSLIKPHSEHDDKIKTLASNLSNLLKINHINENDLAKKLDIPYNTIHRIITGTTSDPRLSTLKQIADYFDVSLDALVHQEPPMPSVQQKPTLAPLIPWDTLNSLDLSKNISPPEGTPWIQIPAIEGIKKHPRLFALLSTRSMQSRFPAGTTFVINADENPIDGDMVLVKFKTQNAISLRELVTDPPRWQLLPITPSSESIYFDDNEHSILGVVMVTLIKTR